MTLLDAGAPAIATIDAEAIRADAEAMFAPPANIQHREVLTAILDGLSKIDFHLAADIDPEKPVPQKTQIVLTVGEVLRVARDLNCGLCRNGAFIYTYNGEYWQLLDKDDLERFLGNAAEKVGIKWVDARHFEMKAKLAKQFQADAHLPTPQRRGDKVLINLRNGTCELGDGEFVIRPPDPTDFLTYQLPFNFDRDASCPKWQSFLDEVLPDEDRSRQRVLAEFVGYVFARHLKLEQCLILHGTGANGKSVFFDVITALLGEENVANVSLESLSKSEYHRATLANKLLNYSSESSTRLQADTFKRLTSGEPIEARLPYGQPMILRDYARLAFNSNELPHDVEHSEAFFRRFLIIPFDVTVSVERRDPSLADDIIDCELSGVFNWMLDGLQRLVQQGGFTRSTAVEAAIATFRRESDENPDKTISVSRSRRRPAVLWEDIARLYDDKQNLRRIVKAFDEYREYPDPNISFFRIDSLYISFNPDSTVRFVSSRVVEILTQEKIPMDRIRICRQCDDLYLVQRLGTRYCTKTKCKTAYHNNRKAIRRDEEELEELREKYRGLKDKLKKHQGTSTWHATQRESLENDLAVTTKSGLKVRARLEERKEKGVTNYHGWQP